MDNLEQEAGIVDAEVVDSGGTREVMVRAEIDVQVATAHRYPRSIAAFRQQALTLVAANVETAESCFYTLKRKEKNGQIKLIVGPSVRLAEIAASCWKNLRVQTQIFSEGGDMIVARAVAHDLEANVAVSQEISRRITTSDGRRYSVDMITLTSNAAQSIAYRNAIFRVVPRTYIDQLLAAARKVAVGDVKTLVERRQAMSNWTTKAGVPLYRVFAVLGVKGLDDVGLEHLETWIGLATAVRDNQMSIDDAFPEPVAEQETKADETAPTGQAPSPTPPAGKENKPRRGRPPKSPQAPPATSTPPQSTQPPQASAPPQAQTQSQAQAPAAEPVRHSAKGLIQEVEDTGKELLLRLYDNQEFLIGPEQFDVLKKYIDREVSLLFETRGRRNVLIQYRITPEEGDAKQTAPAPPQGGKSAFFDAPGQG